VAARMRYGGASLDEATRAVVFEDLASHGIGAGLVAIDARGEVAAPYNTLGMARGWIGVDGALRVGTHAEIFAMEPG
jgi:L-asparaginase / beta-aspartyl-peptidase